MKTQRSLCLARFLGWVSLLMAVLISASCASSSEKKTSGDDVATISREGSLPEGKRASLVMLGPGDTISVNVWRNADMSKEVVLDKAGYIDLPVVGRVKVAGLTVPELKKVLVKEISTYVVNPKVDISLGTIVSQRVYIFGEVATPGSLTLDNDLRAWEAISRAGGFTDDANKKKVVLLRPELENREEADNKINYRISVLDLDIVKAIKNGSMEGQGWLASGDIVYVPRSKIASVEAFMNRLNALISPISNLERAIIMGPDTIDVLTGEFDSDSNSVIVAP